MSLFLYTLLTRSNITFRITAINPADAPAAHTFSLRSFLTSSECKIVREWKLPSSDMLHIMNWGPLSVYD
jgi:hypothetical protein